MERDRAVMDMVRSAYLSLRPSERKVADFILENPQKISSLSIVQLSGFSGVSQPTVIRFVRALGFTGFREFRHALIREEAPSFSHGIEPLNGFYLQPDDQIADLPYKTVRASKNLLEDTLKSLSVRSLSQAVETIANAKAVILYAVEDSLGAAYDLLNKLTYLGISCRLHTDSYLQIISAGHLEPGEAAVAFSYSGRSMDTVHALKLAKESGAAAIAVTNFPDAVIQQYADIVLNCGGGGSVIYGNAIFSRVSQIAVVDMLYMGIILSDYSRFSK